MEPLKRFFKPSENSFFLLGPRGTGKTYWAKHFFKNNFWVNLLDGATYQLLYARPEKLYDFVKSNPSNVIIIDEIQKIPALLETVHWIMGDFPDKQFVLTGSSARKLRRKGVNLLGGRASHKTMHPFMAAELGKDFDFEKALNIGMLPVIWGAKKPEEALHAYIRLYIQEEVQLEGAVRQLDAFYRFLEVMSFSQGSVLNISNVANESMVQRKTVEAYLHILEDLLIAFRLNVFRTKAKRRLASHPKFFYFDTGVFRSIRPKEFLDDTNLMNGPALETLVVQHLRAWCDYSKGNHKLYYWQTQNKMEVDFIVYGESGLYAFEVKNSTKVRPEYLTGLKAFGKDYPTSQRFLLYRGNQNDYQDDILCLPCEAFLKSLKPDQLFKK